MELLKTTHLTFESGGSSKFYVGVELGPTEGLIAYGRIGGGGQSYQVVPIKDMHRKLNEKAKKGYISKAVTIMTSRDMNAVWTRCQRHLESKNPGATILFHMTESSGFSYSIKRVSDPISPPTPRVERTTEWAGDW